MKNRIMMMMVMAMMLLPNYVFGYPITFTWDANTETDLGGYKVYYSNDSAVTVNPVVKTLGKVTTVTIHEFDPTKPYYVAVTAFNTAGIESAYSNIVYIPKAPEVPRGLSYEVIIKLILATQTP